MTRFLILIAIVLFSLQLWGQKIDSLSEKDKIYMLSKVWSEVKRNFVYYDRLNFNWDSLYIENIEEIKSCKNDYEVYRLLQSYVAKLQDGHTGFYPPQSFWENYGRPPIRTKLIEDKVLITKIYNRTLKAKGLSEGLEIIEINGMPVKAYACKHIIPYVFASTPQGLDVVTYEFYLLGGLKQEIVKIKTKNEKGETTNFELDRKLKADIQSQNETLKYSQLENRIGVLEINNFFDEHFTEKFDSIYVHLLKSKALIIDIRNNGGGNSDNAYYVLKHLTSQPFLESAWRTRKYMPAFISWGKEEEWFEEEAQEIQSAEGEIYSKPIVLLISSVTFSAAEDFCVAFKQMNRGVLVGQLTGGSTGNPIFFTLPDGSRLQICTKEDMFANGEKFVGIGITPDIEVNQTIDDFRDGIDKVLNIAIDTLNE